MRWEFSSRDSNSDHTAVNVGDFKIGIRGAPSGPEAGRPPNSLFMKTATLDPRTLHEKPPFPKQQQPPPGTEAELTPIADHGERTYTGHGRLKGKRALITGADSGIGRAVALAFAREGADIAVSYLSEDEDAKETERLITEAGRKSVLLAGDIGSSRHCQQIVETTRDALGGIDILVNNAAYQRTYQKFEEIPDDEFEEAYRVNIFGMFYMCKQVLPGMKAGDCIINTASIQSFDPTPSLLPYASTKAAIINFTKSLAGLAAERGIRVNAVAPGPVWTPLIPSTMDPEKVSQFGKTSTLGRPAQPAELAPLFVFLASNEASYVTGETFAATGGQMPL